MHDLPVNRFVVVDSNITKPHGIFHSQCQFLTNDSEFGQYVKGLAHGCRWWNILACNDVSPDIHAELYGTRKVKCKDILRVQIPRQNVS